jgi:hypothetical protein
MFNLGSSPSAGVGSDSYNKTASFRCLDASSWAHQIPVVKNKGLQFDLLPF